MPHPASDPRDDKAEAPEDRDLSQTVVRSVGKEVTVLTGSPECHFRAP